MTMRWVRLGGDAPTYLPVNFTAFVVTAGIHPATDASVAVVKERAMRTALALTP